MAAQLELTHVAILLMGVAVVAVGCGWILARSSARGQQGSPASAGEIEGVIAAVIELANDKLAATTDRIASQVEQSGLLRDQVFDHRTDVVQSELVELRTALAQVTTAVTAVQQDRAVQHSELVTRLESSAQSSAELYNVANNLREVLAHPQRRGSWGERTAADVLAHAGFVEGVSFRRQQSLAGGTRPDFSFQLPQGRELHMDVKFPADNYFRYLEATEEDARHSLRKKFCADVRQRIGEVSRRGYIDSETTLDYALLFIPNESVFSFICETDPGLVDAALGQHVILCSPFTLFSVLAVIRQSVEIFRVEQSTDEVLRSLRAFSQQWERYCESLDKVDRQLRALTNSVEELAGPRRRQLQRTIDKIAELDGSTTGVAMLSEPESRHQTYAAPPAHNGDGDHQLEPGRLELPVVS
jgi:DNA recombination protein RmuC